FKRRMSMKKIFITTIVLALIQFAKAQTDTSNLLNEVVVTATKSPKKLSETGKLVTVITREQIEQSGATDLAQILNEQTAVTLNGAVSNPGKDKSVFLLGATAKYTLILLDGIPLNDPASVDGSFDIRLLSLENIDRIEILKGSQSTLYGSSAVAGVINLISKKATSNQPQLSGLLTYGSYNSFKGNANISQNTKLLDYNINYVHYSTDGISEALDTTGKAGFDKDGFKQDALQATVGIHVSDKIKITPYYRYTKFKGEYDDDAFTDGDNHYNASLINAGLNGSAAYNKGTVYFNYGYDFTKRDYLSSYSFSTKGKFNNAEAFVHHSFNKFLQMIAGADYQTYHIAESDTTNSIISPYTSFFIHAQQWNIELGGRFNHHNQYGNNFTYSFNPSYLIDDKTKLFVNITSGFRAPSIDELFGPFGANPNLKPEKSNSQEAGIQTELIQQKLSVTIAGFNRTINDVIIYANNGYENRDKQHDYGAEFELNYSSAKFSAKASYAYITGKITEKIGKDTSFYNLLRRPKNAVNLFAAYHITNHFLISSTLLFNDKRTDNYFDPVTFASSEVELKSYALWNAYAEYKFLKNKLNLFASVNNITNNKNYYEVYGYAVQGTNFTAGFRFQL
ncbi:MAG: TonB-dependent receptor, partial [Parafilimonas sp.]